MACAILGMDIAHFILKGRIHRGITNMPHEGVRRSIIMECAAAVPVRSTADCLGAAAP